MKQLTSTQVRKMWLDFWRSKGHSIEPSANLIPVNDPTLLWINSGVSTLKRYFDGSIIPDNKRIANIQKSIRTTDIENVGKTDRHHTMFEMLGNFSIGDYFRDEAIEWAVELLTSPKWFDFPPEKLYITYYPSDIDSYNCWLKTGIASDHLIPLESNFWEIGSGPAGPDTEIFFDRGAKFDPDDLGVKLLEEEVENDRYIEIWNIVFSQFNADPSLPRSEYQELPNKNIDTGMGFERLVAIIQNAKTNFDTDLFLPIIRTLETLSSAVYDSDENNDVNFRVIADHIRSLVFAIGDGAFPSNDGRGYVLRRLLRRSVIYGRKLGIVGPFLYKLVRTVAQIMGSSYPEVLKKHEFIEKIIKHEEQTFVRTIEDGSYHLERLLEGMRLSNNNMLDGARVFQLYDTYGFPIELTEELAEAEGVKIDHKGFKLAMSEQQTRARLHSFRDSSMSLQSKALADLTEQSSFNYEKEVLSARLLTIIVNDKCVSATDQGKSVLVFEETPFYAEMGGQVADHGRIVDGEGNEVAQVVDVQRAPHGQTLHISEVFLPLSVGTRYKLEIDRYRRYCIMKNHTATHLLHASLRSIIGDHALQSGSINEQGFLRFDFMHFEAMTTETLRHIEEVVNEKIWASIPVESIEVDLDTAKRMGAMALFGEKYGHNVRVVTIDDYSIELCGGTHVNNTSEIGIFKIIKEEGIGSGIRRILAVTSREAFIAYREKEEVIRDVERMVKSQNTSEVVSKVQTLQRKIQVLQRENAALKAKDIRATASTLFKDVQEAAGYRFIATEVSVSSIDDLKSIADVWKQNYYSDLLVLVAKFNGKINILVANRSKDIHAGHIVKRLAPIVSGRGGGGPFMAMAGGKNLDASARLLASVAEILHYPELNNK